MTAILIFCQIEIIVFEQVKKDFIFFVKSSRFIFISGLTRTAFWNFCQTEEIYFNFWSNQASLFYILLKINSI